MVEANWDAKLQTVVQEQLARARLEWLKEKASGQVDDLVHVEKSLGKSDMDTFSILVQTPVM